MAADAGVVTVSAPRAPLAALTQRASLSAVASLLDYAAKAAVSLVVTPVLVGALGRSLYGVWEMLGRLIGYMTATDGRPTEALRLMIAQRQSARDADGNRRYVGGALVVWLLLLPLVAVVGGVLSWFAPAITNAPIEQQTAVRATCVLLVVSFLLGTLAAVPESVLRGMNLGYKRMGLQAGLNVLGGVLAVAAVHAGLGLTGLGGSLIARAVFTGIIFWLLVRKYVWWFGVTRPRKADVTALFGMSVWLSVGDLITKLLLASDVLILGAVISPAAVTTYALTSYAARTALGIHVFTAGAAVPGLGGVLGERQYDRATQIRRELLVLTWLFVTAVGTTILLWNRSFLALWVGERNYAGPWVDLLIVVTMLQTAFIRTDAYIIDAALKPKLRVLVGALSAAVTLGMGVALTHAFGIIGLCFGVLAGRAIQSIAFPVLVRSCLGRPAASAEANTGAARLAAITVVLFGVGAIAGARLQAPSWPVWGSAVAVTAVLVFGVALAAGPPAPLRLALVARLRAIAMGVRRRP